MLNIPPIESAIIDRIYEAPFEDPFTLVLAALTDVVELPEEVQDIECVHCRFLYLMAFCADVQADHHIGLEIEAEDLAYEAESFLRRLAEGDKDVD